MTKKKWQDNTSWLLHQAFAFFALIFLAMILTIIWYTVKSSELWDLNVFYSSAQTALHGGNIYQVYGSLHLPYWYFPWVAWLFIPLALFSFNTAKVLYIILTICSLVFIQFAVLNSLSIKFNLYFQAFFIAISAWMCWLLFHVGQIDFLLAGITVICILLIAKKKYLTAGFLFPLLLVKPHLLTIFIPYTFLRGGKKYFLTAILSLSIMLAISFFIQPTWLKDMIHILQSNGGRTDNYWDFTILSEFIGLQENWSGTNNLFLFFAQFIIANFILWKNRHLQVLPFLSLALTASLFCAPRAYSYNFPFLIPSLLWLSDNKPINVVLLWALIGIVSLATQFSTGSYLIVLGIFALSVTKANHFSYKNISCFLRSGIKQQ